MSTSRWLAGLAVLVATVVAPPAAGAAVTLPQGSISLPTSGSFLYMNSEPGDYIGGGVERLFTSTDTAINGTLPPAGDILSASVIQGAYVNWFYVSIAAPPGQPLALGSYTGAVRASFRPPGTPGIDVSGNGRGCNTVTGQFDVNELSYAPTGELLVFDATFEQHCEGGPAALFGRIRIENPPPPPDNTPPTLYLPGDIVVEAPDAIGTSIWYSATASDDRDPSPSVTCSPAAGAFFPVGTTTVECRATDRSGNATTGSFSVIVRAPLALGVTTAPRGNVSSRTGVASVSGVVTCSRGLYVTVYGALRQLFANRVSIVGQFSVTVYCEAPSTPWSATVEGSNGRFGAGAATLDASVHGCELSCRSTSIQSSVRLSGTR